MTTRAFAIGLWSILASSVPGATNGDPAYEDAPAPAGPGSDTVTSDLAAVVDIDGLETTDV